jgi:hypothetical protein
VISLMKGLLAEQNQNRNEHYKNPKPQQAFH